MCEILKLYEHISINTNLIQVSEPRTFFSELEKPQTKNSIWYRNGLIHKYGIDPYCFTLSVYAYVCVMLYMALISHGLAN